MYRTDHLFNAIELIFPLLLPSFYIEELGSISASPKKYPCVSFCRLSGSQDGYKSSKGFQRESVRFVLGIEVKDGTWCQDVSELEDYKDHLALHEYFRLIMDEFIVSLVEGPTLLGSPDINYQDSIFAKHQYRHERTSNDYGFRQNPPHLTTGVVREYSISFVNRVNKCCLQLSTIEDWRELQKQFKEGSISYNAIEKIIQQL